MVKAEHYPFKKYKVSKLNQETAKRALSKEDINRVLQYQTDNRFMRLPIDLFAFTYYMGGGKSSVSCPLKPSDSAPLC